MMISMIGYKGNVVRLCLFYRFLRFRKLQATSKQKSSERAPRQQFERRTLKKASRGGKISTAILINPADALQGVLLAAKLHKMIQKHPLRKCNPRSIQNHS